MAKKIRATGYTGWIGNKLVAEVYTTDGQNWHAVPLKHQLDSMFYDSPEACFDYLNEYCLAVIQWRPTPTRSTT